MTTATSTTGPTAPAPDPQSAVRAALVAVRDMKARLRARDREPIAVVGIGCRFPGGGDGPDGFWRMLCDGIDAVTPIPADRWDVAAFYDPDPAVAGKSSCREAALLPEVRTFDAAFFNITPREARTLDPQQRLLLETGWEALEHAGIAADRLAGSRTGLFVGTMNHDYDTLVRRSASPEDLDAYVGTGTGTSFLAGRLAYVLGLNGPAMAVDTACSSSALAVHLACQSLRAGECDMALAGAANLLLVPDTFVTMSRLRALAPDGRCKTFDAAADGYGRGEGAGMVVLKRLSDARAAGDRIIAVIAGSAVNHGGAAAGLTVPNGAAQQAVIRAALDQAEVGPHAIDYVEAHGTGTALGDPIEIAALAAVQAGRPAGRPLQVATLKTNIGHLEAAAGIAAIIKVALMLHHGRVPPHLHFRSPNPSIDLDAAGMSVPTMLSDWPAGDGARHAGVSAFGMSGTNVHLILRADDPVAPADLGTAGPRLLALSAPDAAALEDLARTTAARLAAPDAPGLADAAWTLATGRSRFGHRLALVADDAGDAAARLTSGRGVHRGLAPASRTRVAFMFSGQGSQHAGMAAGLHRDEPVFRDMVDRCLDLFAPALDLPLADVLWGAGGGRINDTAYAQPALFTVQAGLVALWRSLGVEPDVVLGHSVGEFAAAWTAGALELEDAARLVAGRGRLMQALPHGGAMVATFAAAADLAPLVAATEGTVAIAGLNGAAETVLSGEAGALARLCAGLDARGIRWKPLAVSHAFHSPLMQPAVAPFAAFAEGIPARAPKLPWISTVTGRPIETTPDAAYWAGQIRQPVAFAPALDELARHRIGLALEIGPARELTALARRHLPETGTGDGIRFQASLRPGTDDRASLTEAAAAAWTAGAAVQLDALHRAGTRRRVTMPGYPFQRRRHWITPEPQSSAPKADAPSFCAVTWEPKALPEGRARAGQWLVVPDAGRVADALEASGLPMTRIAAADASRHLSGDIAGILLLSGLDLPAWGSAAALRPAIEDALALARATTSLPTAPPMLWATRSVQSAGETPSGMAGAALWGLGRSVALEHPDGAAVLLDLPADAPPAAILDLLPRLDACRQDRERQWAWRAASGWQVARLAPVVSGTTPAIVRSDRSYLVTGGSRGVGLAIAVDLARRGAGHVLVASRTPAESAALAEITAAGARAWPLQVDIADAGALAGALARAVDSGAPPLAGIVHAAGVLRDGVLTGLGWPAFADVLAPKLDGLAALRAATADDELDFLALVSSGAGVLGSAGQGNYAAANACLDAAARLLSADGRPAVSIAFGPWRDTGMAATGDAGWARKGVRPLDPATALAALATLSGNGPEAAVLPFDWTAYRTVDPSAFLDRMAPRPAHAASVPDLAEMLAQAPAGDRLWLAEREIWQIVRDVLHLPAYMAPERERPFSAFGMDSLMALDLRADLTRRIGRPLPATLTYDHSSLAALALHLAGDVLGLLPAAASPSDAAPAPSQALRDQVASMGETDLDAYVQRKLAARRGERR